jgi:phage terminase large subunit-like protein
VFENRVDEETSALRVMVQHQTHPSDLTNHVRSLSSWSPDNRMGWAWLCIALVKGREPANYSGVTPYGRSDPRREGENMQSSRYPERVLADKRLKLGSHGFEAQYNQNAAPQDGGWFKRSYFSFFVIEGQEPRNRQRPKDCRTDAPYVLELDPYTKRPKLDWLTLSVDATFGSTNEETASAVGLLTLGGLGPRRFVFDDRTRIMDSLQMKQAIRDVIATSFVTRLLIELKANGQSLVTELTQELKNGYYLAERDGQAVKVPILWPDGSRAIVVVEAWTDVRDSKPGRARTMLAEYEVGLVHLPDGAPWLEEHVGEVSLFPNSRRNDRIDAMSQAMTRYRTAADVETSVGGWRISV